MKMYGTCFFFVPALLISLPLSLCDVAPVIQKSARTSDIEAGQKFKISCVLSSGSVPVDFSWLKNDQVIVPDDNMQIQNMADDSSFLTIRSTRSDHSGVYKCIATNSVGSDHNEVQVVVKGMQLTFIIHRI